VLVEKPGLEMMRPGSVCALREKQHFNTFCFVIIGNNDVHMTEGDEREKENDVWKLGGRLYEMERGGK
jgi:hypothetical protein